MPSNQNPVVVSRLLRSVILNGFGTRTEVHTSPLLDVNDSHVSLRVPAGEPKNAHVIAFEEDQTDSIPLLTKRFDAYSFAGEVNLMKIDAEGAEEKIWHGMSKVLHGDRLRTVVLEFASARYSSPDLFLAGITRFGFEISVIDPQAGIKSASVAEILDLNPNEDVMLLLKR